jgi:hypothetical protein
LKEGIKDIAAYRVARGEGVSEDFMIKGMGKLHKSICSGLSKFRNRIQLYLEIKKFA